jgi:hypothetical protein
MKTNSIKIIYFVSLFLFIGTMQSCTKGFEDLNTDPKNPTVATMPGLFNKVINSLNLSNQQSNLYNTWYYAQTQLLVNKALYDDRTASIWDQYYGLVANIRLLYDKLAEFESSSSLKTGNARACADILYAYKSLEMVDFFGDFPFTEGGKGLYGTANFTPPYDSQQEIYKQCLDMLNKASLALTENTSDQYSYGGSDTFLKGNILRWKKFANSLLLRYGMQLAAADASYANYVSSILGDAGKYPLLTGTENIGLWPKEMSNARFDYHYTWANETTLCMGSTIWKQMSENDNPDGSGIYDPRTYIYFEPNEDGEWVPQSQNPDGKITQPKKGAYNGDSYEQGGRNKGLTEEEYLQKGGKDGGQCPYVPVRFYLVCNEDFIPDLFLRASEVYFLKAEAYNRGTGVGKNQAAAKEAYEAGIKSSMDFWYDEIYAKYNSAASGTWQWQKPEDLDPAAQTKRSTYLTHPTVVYSSDEATARKQIYRQLWLDCFFQPSVAFNLFRRTLETPEDRVSGNYDPNIYNFYTCRYPESERNYNTVNFNKATNNGANNSSDKKKLFWHK